MSRDERVAERDQTRVKHDSPMLKATIRAGFTIGILDTASVNASLFEDLSQSLKSLRVSGRKLLIPKMERCWSGRSGTLGN